MKQHFHEYKDLVELLLGPIRERPGMYLGEAKISLLPNFITGYQMGYHVAHKKSITGDRYFGDNELGDNGFIAWYFKKQDIVSSTWHTEFLKEANNDEKEALQLFFRYLEEFDKGSN